MFIVVVFHRLFLQHVISNSIISRITLRLFESFFHWCCFELCHQLNTSKIWIQQNTTNDLRAKCFHDQSKQTSFILKRWFRNFRLCRKNFDRNRCKFMSFDNEIINTIQLVKTMNSAKKFFKKNFFFKSTNEKSTFSKKSLHQTKSSMNHLSATSFKTLFAIFSNWMSDSKELRKKIVVNNFDEMKKDSRFVLWHDVDKRIIFNFSSTHEIIMKIMKYVLLTFIISDHVDSKFTAWSKKKKIWFSQHMSTTWKKLKNEMKRKNDIFDKIVTVVSTCNETRKMSYDETYWMFDWQKQLYDSINDWRVEAMKIIKHVIAILFELILKKNSNAIKKRCVNLFKNDVFIFFEIC